LLLALQQPQQMMQLVNLDLLDEMVVVHHVLETRIFQMVVVCHGVFLLVFLLVLLVFRLL
jgi:hypothetical protein